MPIGWSVQPALQCTVVTVADPYTFKQWEAAFADLLDLLIFCLLFTSLT
jgi:hypothetical protein